MGKKTKLTVKSNYPLYKQTARNLSSNDSDFPVWTFRDVDSVDRDGLFKFDPNRKDFDTQDFLDKMISFSNMTWREIKNQKHDKGKTKNHFLSESSLSSVANERIIAKGFEEFIDYVFSFALNNLVRVIGICDPDSAEFKVVWYDPKHQFAPSNKQKS